MSENITPCSLAAYSGLPINLDDILMGRISEDRSLVNFGERFKMKRNYFDCATYFFDGVFNVAKFPKGSIIYHGSSFLANSNVSYPVGKEFYMPLHDNKYHIPLEIAGNSKDTVETLMSENANVYPSWYSNYETSKMYSSDKWNRQDPLRNHLADICGDKCIFAYKLKKDIVMFLLDDDYNIAKLFATESVPEDIKDTLQKMFNIQDRIPFRENNDNPFQRVRYGKDRNSIREYDTKFIKWACPNLVKKIGYAGICAMVQKSMFHGGNFHMEFIFCNPFKYLVRDLSNEYDWQYRNDDIIPENLRNLLYGFKLYKSINVNFHAGNLYEHSIWTLLWCEQIYFENRLQLPNEVLKLIDPKILGLSALLHDIGKMTFNDEILYNNYLFDYVYFSVKEHPSIGELNILTDSIPQFRIEYDNDGFKNSVTVIGKGGIDNVLLELGLDVRYKYILAFVSELHWHFGDFVLRRYNQGYDIETLSKEYISKMLDVFDKKYIVSGFDFLTLVAYLVMVSLADIYAAQPYGIGRLAYLKSSIDLNKKSKIYPFIHNVPKSYPGKDVINDFKLDNNGLYAAHMCIMSLYKSYQRLNLKPNATEIS